MYVINGIAYAGENTPVIKVSGVRPMNDFKLWVRFTTGEAKIFDCKLLFDTPVFAPLSDKAIFDGVYIDYGVPVWNNGDIDISPEILYEEGVESE